MKNAIPSAIYVISSPDGLIKVGRSRDPKTRLQHLKWGAGKILTIEHVTEVRDDASYIEAEAHRILAHARTQGEWFSAAPSEAIDAIKRATAVIEERKAAIANIPKRRRRVRWGTSGELVHFRVPPAMLAELDRLVAESLVPTDRSEVVRQLLDEGLREMERCPSG